MTTLSGRALALDGVTSVAFYKKSLSQYDFGHDGFSANLTYTTLRYYYYLLKVVDAHLHKEFAKKDLDVLYILLTGSAELLYTSSQSYAVINEWVTLTHKEWAKPLVNAILRKIDANSRTIIENTDHSHPTWLYKKLAKYYKNTITALIEANNTPAPMTLRVDKDIRAYSELLDVADIAHTIYSNSALILTQPVAVNTLPQFASGGVYVQDISAIEAIEHLAVQPTDRVLDVCSAPGGKATHLAALSTHPITCIESNETRLAMFLENIARMGAQVELIHDDASTVVLHEQYDKVCIDAPCSATGVIRRHPDIKLLRKKTDIGTLVAIQRAILSNIWQYVKAGGELLYATCSILPEENTQQIQWFLAAYSDAELITPPSEYATFGQQILPQYQQDGFYYAKLRKSTQSV